MFWFLDGECRDNATFRQSVTKNTTKYIILSIQCATANDAYALKKLSYKTGHT